MSSKVLFVLEGAKTEKQIVNNLKEHFVNKHTLIECVFGNVIYELYDQLSKDEDLDTFSLLKEKNFEELKTYNRNDFAEIYLFFDYDGHSHCANDETLKLILRTFDNETENGKLYISYPMVEALKHISDFGTFKDAEVNCKKNIKYKSIVNDECKKEFLHFKNYKKDDWYQLIDCHLKKMNYIAKDIFQLPDTIVSQSEIFSKQEDKYINPRQTVAVLSGFPIFIHDYYGNEGTLKFILPLNNNF